MSYATDVNFILRKYRHRIEEAVLYEVGFSRVFTEASEEIGEFLKTILDAAEEEVHRSTAHAKMLKEMPAPRRYK